MARIGRKNWQFSAPEFYRCTIIAVAGIVGDKHSMFSQEGFQPVITGVHRFLASEKPPIREGKPLWQRGSTQLLSFCSDSETIADYPIILVPSLINKAHIFDLLPEVSLVAFLRAQGFNPLLLDWGVPGAEEADFTVAEYVTQRLLPSMQYLSEKSGETPVLLGYCLGGMMALAAAQLAPEKTRGLVLVATPWDFHAGLSPEKTPLAKDMRQTTGSFLELLLTRHHAIPPAIIQHLFYLKDPQAEHQRFTDYAHLPDNDKKALLFEARQHWLQDGVPLTANVAKDCFVHFSRDNRALHEQWQVGGKAISPKKVTRPTYLLNGAHDALVPAECSVFLKESIVQSQQHIAPTGHLGLVSSPRAAKAWWLTLADWLKTH